MKKFKLAELIKESIIKKKRYKPLRVHENVYDTPRVWLLYKKKPYWF